MRAVVKLNDAVSGEGNAVVDLATLPAPGSAGAAALLEHVRSMTFELSSMTLARLWIPSPKMAASSRNAFAARAFAARAFRYASPR